MDSFRCLPGSGFKCRWFSASSQITDGNVADPPIIRIPDHQGRTRGSLVDLSFLLFNSFYTRTIPSHSIEMTVRASPPERGRYAGCSSHSKGQPGSTTKAGCRDSPVRTEEGRDLRHTGLPSNAGRTLRDSQPATVSQSGRSDEKTVCSIERAIDLVTQCGLLILECCEVCLDSSLRSLTNR